MYHGPTCRHMLITIIIIRRFHLLRTFAVRLDTTISTWIRYRTVIQIRLADGMVLW